MLVDLDEMELKLIRELLEIVISTEEIGTGIATDQEVQTAANLYEVLTDGS